jgi:twinkle protein
MVLQFPFVERGQVINHKYRLTSARRMAMDKDAPLLWLGVDCLEDERVRNPSNPVVVVEGEMDWLTCHEIGRDLVLSVPNGAPSQRTDTDLTPESDAERFRFFWRSRSLTDRVARFILAVDNDEPGTTLAYELARRIGVERCLWPTYPEGCKDLNDVLLRHGPQVVEQVLRDAKPYPVRGLHRMSDFPDPPPIQPIPCGIAALDPYVSIVPGTFTVVTGFANQGKSSLMFAIAANLMKAGHSIAIGSFETWPKPILENTLISLLCGKFHGYCTESEKAEARAIMEDRLHVIHQLPQEEEDEMTLEDVLSVAEVAVLRDGMRVLIIDPWNELEHKRRKDETETEYTNRALQAMKRFAIRMQVAVILIAHPRKPFGQDGQKMAPPGLYDISGSAAYANKADYGIVVHTPDKDSGLSQVHITKVRHGLPGKTGRVDLEWDWKLATYRSTKDGDDGGFRLTPPPPRHFADDLD